MVVAVGFNTFLTSLKLMVKCLRTYVSIQKNCINILLRVTKNPGTGKVIAPLPIGLSEQRQLQIGHSGYTPPTRLVEPHGLPLSSAGELSVVLQVARCAFAQTHRRLRGVHRPSHEVVDGIVLQVPPDGQIFHETHVESAQLFGRSDSGQK